MWSPGWLGDLQQIQVRRRTTFDSSATPKPGQKRPVPQQVAPVDLSALGEQIAATAERAKADNPAELRRQIVALKQALASAEAATKPAPLPEPVPVVRVETVEVPVLDEASRGVLTDTVDRLTGHVDAVTAALAEVVERVASLTRRVDAVAANQPHSTPRPVSAGGAEPAPTAPGPTRPAVVHAAPAQPSGVLDDTDVDVEAARPRANNAILRVLAVHGPTHADQVAVLTGYSRKSGGFRNALSALRTAGLIDRGQPAAITEAGLAAVGPIDPLPYGHDLLVWWQNHAALGKAERTILDVLHDHGGGPIPVDQIAAHADYSASSGGFRNALSRLRSLGLATGGAADGGLTLNPDLID